MSYFCRRAKLALSVATFALSASAAQATDLIVYNALITTLDPARAEATALAVDDGKIESPLVS